VQGGWSHFLWPPKAVKVAHEVQDVLSSSLHGSSPLLMHSMSVGGYIYTVTTDELRSTPAGKQITDRIIGQVYDSLVIGGYSGIPNFTKSASKMITSNTFVQLNIQALLSGYFALTKKHTADRFTHYVNEAVHNPIRKPIMLFASEADPWCDLPELVTYIVAWQEKVRVKYNCWKDSGHVQHYKTYPLQYRLQLYKFLKEVLAEHNLKIDFS